MTTKNADMPAMPLSGDAYTDFAGYDGTNRTSYNPECQGLTKREMIAMHVLSHLASEGDYGEYVERKAKVAIEYADTLLVKLERKQ